MKRVIYGIKNCDTMKKAMNWLSEQGIAYEFIDYKKAGVAASHLADWNARAGWEKLLNRQGTTWRKLVPATQAGVSDARSARSLMLAQASVIKRPVVEWNSSDVTVGFNPTDWQTRRV